MKKSCSHCQLSYDENFLFKSNINGKDEYFCCKGCEGVFRILSQNDLGVFYDKLGNSKLAPPKEYQDIAKFTKEAYIQKYIKEIDDHTNEVSLIIEDIHCVACVWLNQKVLLRKDGIISADINYTNNKAKITYNKDKITLSDIIEVIRSIGYNAQLYDPQTLENINAKERKNYYIKMIVGVFCTMNIMWIAIAQYLGYFYGMEQNIKDILNLASFLLATPTLFFSGSIFFKSGYYGLKNKIINMDLLVSIGAFITYIYSIYASISHIGETYFESLTMIITFILIGKFLEIRGRKNAGDTIDKLIAELPTTIKVLENDKYKIITPQEVNINDIIEVAPGEKIIIDGILLSKDAQLDTSMLTGESKLAELKSGDEIISGNINTTNAITYKATKTFDNSVINTIITILQDSINKKPNIQNKANSISYLFSTFIFLVALCTFIVWWNLDNLQNAIVISVSVIIIACPCALALATPIASIRGISEAFKYKILIKEAKFLEIMAKTNTIIFDKTGTLTYGNPRVINEKILKEYDKNILKSFVSKNTHPISKGVATYLSDDTTQIKRVDIMDFKIINQKGIIANNNNQTLIGGSKQFLLEQNIKITESNSNTMDFYYAINGELVAIFYLQDTLKESAKEVVEYFIMQDFRVIICSGDKREVVESIAKELKISEFYFEQTPINKSDLLDKLQSNGYKTIMVGDGINDTMAMNKSDIAISMGQGSDIAINYSDIVVLDDDIANIKNAHNLSKQTYKVIKQNITISIIYNILTIPLAALGYIIPLFAALSMSLSSLIVTLNSAKIKAKNKHYFKKY